MYVFESRVRYSEVGSDGRLRLESLLDYFQDVSTFHSEDLGVGMDYLQGIHLAWVLSSWQIVVERYPVVGEKIHACTYPYEFKGFFGLRNFILKTAEGEVLAYANSMWTLLDMEKMLPTKPTEKMIEKYILEEKYPMDYSSRKIAVPDGGCVQENIEVKAHHLDTNDHVNNGQYVRMALDLLPTSWEVKQLRVEYKKSAKLGDMITPVVHTASGGYVVELNGQDGKAFAVVELLIRE